MSASEVQWIGSSCGRHGSYTFYKGFRINSRGAEKSYCLGEFYFVRNSEDKPICIAELQLIWHDAGTDSKLASARLYFKPENTPFGRLSIHGEDELLYADQKVIVKCEDMVQWEYTGTEWTTGLIPPLESDFTITQETSIDEFTGNTEHKYRLQNKALPSNKDSYVEKIIIMTFQAYCRYKALIKRLENGMTIAKSRLTALGGVMVSSKSTRIVFCRECFSCPDVEKFHLSGENKAPVLKGRPRKKRLRNSTLAKELKRKRFLADLEKVKNNLLTKKPKLSESEEGTESDLSEESGKSGESMDEAEQPRITVETPIHKSKPPNGLLPVSIKQVVMVINDKAKAPPPLIPTTKLKGVVTSPPPLQKVKMKTDVPLVTKLDGGPPPLCPITKRPEVSIKMSTTIQSRVSAPESSKPHLETSLPLSSKGYTVVQSVGNPSSTSTVPSIVGSKTDGTKAVEPMGGTDGKTVADSRQLEGKENLLDSNKTKKKRLRQPGSMKEFNEDVVDEDEKFFMRSLRDFMKSRDTPISKIPALGFKRVNLWTMYKTAQKLGGYEMVTTKRLWRQVYDALGGSTTITSAATYTRRHYERLLLPYERFVRGQLNAKKSTFPQATKTSQDSTVPREQLNHTNNSTPAPNRIKSTADNDKVSRITVNSVGSAQRKEPHDNKEMPSVTSNMSRDGLKTTVVKMKPNGAIPPYSVSIQSAKKDNVTPATIVTKSVDVPVSPVHSLPGSVQRNPTVSAPLSKSVASVTPQLTQRRTSVTSSVAPDQTSVTHAPHHVVSTSSSIKSPTSTALWKKDYLAPSLVTQKQNVVTQKQPIKTEIVTPKQVTQVNLRDLQGTSTHKPPYKAIPEEHKRAGPRKPCEAPTKYLTISETYDLIHSQARKRSHGEDTEPSKKPNIDNVHRNENTSRNSTIEPLAKRRRTPSPCHAVSQHHYDVSRNHPDVSRSVSSAESTSRNVVRHSSTNSSSHATPTLHTISGIENGHVRESVVHAEREKSDEQHRHQALTSRPKEIVDLTDGDSSPPYSYHKSSSPFTKIPHSYNQREHEAAGSCQRTDGRLHANSRHSLVTHSKVTRDYRDESAHEKNITNSEVFDYYKAEKQPEFDYPTKSNERTISHLTSVESPDAHFQKWRRRQGIPQYPAYITTNEPPRRRPSITEQLHPQTSPQEHRYVFVQDDGMTPRIIEEVPLMLSKPGLYCRDESFYGAMPFYQGAWPATGVADSVQFKGDPETLRNNNHLRSTSCVFMPTSQMFGSVGPMAPISPPIINQGHVAGGPEAMHQHCIMTSPYPHNHVIVTQTATRPLHSYT